MSGRFAVYLTDEGAKHVDYGLDMDILKELGFGKKTIGAVAEKIGKSRSTVSDRLNKLEKELIVKTVESDDLREKTYTVSALKIADSRDSSASSRAFFRDRARMILDGEIDLYDGLGECIFYGAADGGLNVCPLFTFAAERIGEKIADSCEKNDFLKVSDRLNQMFRTNGIGEFRMSVTYYVNIDFTVAEKYRSAEFNVLNNIYRNIIKAALERNSGKKMRIERMESDDFSRFSFKLFFENTE